MLAKSFRNSRGECWKMKEGYFMFLFLLILLFGGFSAGCLSLKQLDLVNR
jgi:hypothetical protein